MTKQVFYNQGQSFGIGSYKGAFHLSVQGHPSDFYLYDKSRRIPCSRRIKGKPDVFFKLKHQFYNRNQKEFKNLFDELFKDKS
jgi:hypothetical protein